MKYFLILLFKVKPYIALIGYVLQFLYLSVEAKAEAQTSGNTYKQPVSIMYLSNGLFWPIKFLFNCWPFPFLYFHKYQLIFRLQDRSLLLVCIVSQFQQPLPHLITPPIVRVKILVSIITSLIQPQYYILLT